MSSIFRPTTVEDEPHIIEFLTRVFAVGRDAPFVNPALLRWKYWEPRADWDDARSFVMERDGQIVAHAGLWPVTVRTGAKTERGVHMIDWASDPAAPGAGVSLLQRLTRRYDFVYSIGGSKITQSILPKFGFRNVGDSLNWARPIRPWRQLFQHQTRDWRLPLRLARNIQWSRTPAISIEHVWAAVQTDGPVTLAGERGEAFFGYLRQCPDARCLTFDIVHEDRKAGFLALSIVREQTRIAGVWLENPSVENWRTAFFLAQDAALKYTDTSELIASGATDAEATAAAQAGMRLRSRTPVFLFRKGDADPLPLHFQIADNDSVFLRERQASFLT